jgi:hypothetical protein
MPSCCLECPSNQITDAPSEVRRVGAERETGLAAPFRSCLAQLARDAAGLAKAIEGICRRCGLSSHLRRVG